MTCRNNITDRLSYWFFKIEYRLQITKHWVSIWSVNVAWLFFVRSYPVVRGLSVPERQRIRRIYSELVYNPNICGSWSKRQIPTRSHQEVTLDAWSSPFLGHVEIRVCSIHCTRDQISSRLIKTNQWLFNCTSVALPTSRVR